MKEAILGYGVVGQSVHKLFPAACIYDPAFKDISVTKAEVNACSTAFICVPTRMLEDGTCDTSIVEEVLSWLRTPLVIIRSTVAPGTTDRLQKEFPDVRLVFHPEYIGESTAHPFKDELQIPFLILGGRRECCSSAIETYQRVYNASIQILVLPAIEAEIAKYMENCMIATSVTLANEFYNICSAFAADYSMVREAFLLDPRMSRYFTFVFPDNRGFAGRCLPKDINAVIAASRIAGYYPAFLQAVLKNNDRIRNEVDTSSEAFVGANIRPA